MMNIKKLREYEKKGLLKSRYHPTLDISIWNYQECVQYSKKWDPITLACRSLVINNQTGEIVGRGFGKFFNYEENRHTPTESMRVFNKADGSLGILFYFHEMNRWIFSTRGSFESEQSTIGKQMLDKLYPQYVDLDKSLSYMFEIIYPENRIVVNYGTVRKLVYLSSFEVNGTEHLLIEDMRDRGFDVIEEFDFSDKSLDELKTMNIPNTEGFVIRYDSSERVKIKFEDYLKLHKTITNISNKKIYELCCLHTDIESIIADIPDEFHSWVKNIYDELNKKYVEIETICLEFLAENRAKDKKDFFKAVSDHQYKGIICTLYKSEPVESEILRKLIYKCIDYRQLEASELKTYTTPVKKATMIFLIGRSGSGKSTWTIKFMRNRKQCIRLNRDTLRISLFSLTDSRDINAYYSSPELTQKENFVTSVCNEIIRNAIQKKMTIIIDNTNLVESYIRQTIQLADKDTIIEYKVFGEDLDDSELHTRTIDRGLEVPLKIIKKQNEQFKLLLPKLSEIFTLRDPTHIIQDSSLPKSIIFDIDGTLALNLSGRSPYDMTKILSDSPNDSIIQMCKLLKNDGYTIILCSGRTEDGRQHTVEWLSKYGITYSELHMRANNDNRKDFIIKEEFWIDICTRYYIENMFDDRDQVVNHARSLGFKVCQVAEGNF